MSTGYWWLPFLVDFDVTSRATPQYNCFAWALGSDSLWVDPFEYGYWPESIPNDLTVASFIELFRGVGYEPCEDGKLDEGCEKIAVYAVDGEATHAARQLPDGQWTSKLGAREDIVHSTPEELQGDGRSSYGQVVLFMIRPKSGQ